MPSAGPDPLPRRRSHDELLAHVYAEGARRRRRRRRGRVGALAAVVAMAAAGGAVASRLPGQAPPQNVAARGAAAPAGPGPSTT
ncbi:MAG TPA: hypothetical protein VM390_10865, partial [Acidimicrobiales bacterium]|nr:hypothetical protein [Acidimicrobiales bacterium]